MPSKIDSDVGTNFISEKFKSFCKKLSIWHALSSSYNDQSNGQLEICIKFKKRAKIKCYETNAYIDTSLLQTWVTPLSPRLPSLPCFCSTDQQETYCQDLADYPSMCDKNMSNHVLLKSRQTQLNKEAYIHLNIPLLPTGSTVVLQHEEREPWKHRKKLGTDQQATIGDVTRSYSWGNKRQQLADRQPAKQSYRQICQNTPKYTLKNK